MNNSRMSAPNMIPNMPGGAMNFPSGIQGGASNYLSYSNPRTSLNPPVMSSTYDQLNVQQQNQRFGLPQSESFSHNTSHSNDMQANNTMILNEHQDPTTQQLLNKPSNELSAADIFQIVQLANRDIHTKIDNLAQDVSTKITTLQNQIHILEKENKKKDEDISILKYTMTAMQRSLNMIDSKERSNNVVIYGIPEGEIRTDDAILSTDIDKIKCVLRVIGCNHFDDAAVRDWDVSRIGQPRDNYNRVIKVKLASTEDRDEFMKNSKNLKEAEERWKKVYIKKDEHPVYLSEKSRLRAKMLDLKKKPENNGKKIVIKEGKLMIDATVVDKNIFFS